jgi:hypothetical protein
MSPALSIANTWRATPGWVEAQEEMPKFAPEVAPASTPFVPGGATVVSDSLHET